jgi:hypothetical protein
MDVHEDTVFKIGNIDIDAVLGTATVREAMRFPLIFGNLKVLAKKRKIKMWKI